MKARSGDIQATAVAHGKLQYTRKCKFADETNGSAKLHQFS